MEFKRKLWDAFNYWERFRLPYNLVLAVIVAVFWGADIISSGPQQLLGAVIVLSLFAFAANVLYFAAYPVDLAFQFIGNRTTTQLLRWGLSAAGLLLAICLELWIILSPGMA